jgi:hypothetical protein
MERRGIIAAKLYSIAAASFAALVLMAALPVMTSGASAAEGSRGGTFLPLGWDARGQALGGAGVILVRDEAAAYWNPANLVFMTSPGAGIGTTKPIPGLDNLYTVASFATGLLDSRTSVDRAVTVRRLAFGVTMSHLGLKLAEGSGWNEGTFGLSAAFSFNPYNFIGVSWRSMKSWSDLDDAGAWGSALDIGAVTRLTRHMWLAAMARDVWSKVHYPESSWEVGPTLSLALSIEEIIYGRLSGEFDVVFREGELNSYRLGGELLLIRDILWLQAGADVRAVNYSRTIPWCGVTAGLGGARLALAFGFDPEDNIGRQTRVTAAYRF